MYLTFDALGTPNTSDSEYKIDLYDLVCDNDLVVDEETAYGVLVGKLAKWASEHKVKLSETYPLYIYDGEVWDENCERIDAGKDQPGWIRKVAKFAWFVFQEKHYIEYDQVMAYMDSVGWDWVDFDDLEGAVNEDYRSEFNDDYTEFAQEWESEVGDSHIPDRLYDYVDWETYGERLVGDFAHYKWNGRTFLYYQ